MARSTTFQQKKKFLPSDASMFEEIVSEAIAAKRMPYDQWVSLTPTPWVPLAIPTSTDTSLRMTQAGVNAAHALSEKAFSSHLPLQQQFSKDEFTRESFKAIGDTMVNIGKHLPRTDGELSDAEHSELYKSLAKEFAERISDLQKKTRPDLDRHIPCDIFDADQNVTPFEIGPVSFRPRGAWFRAILSSGAAELALKVDARELDLSALEQIKSQEADDAVTALRAVRGYGWVGSVRIVGHTPKKSHEKASVFVGLAIDALGTRIFVDDARRLRKAGRAHVLGEDRLATTLSGALLYGTSFNKPGLGASPGYFIQLINSEKSFLAAAGAILCKYLEERQLGRAHDVIERWANTLFWLGEARREASDFMAVVKYGCALDSISGPGKDASAKIDAFVTAAFGPEPPASNPDIPTAKDAVQRVYREGRNKLAHGEEPGLLEDLSQTRRLGDDLVIALFAIVTPTIANLLTPNSRAFETGVDTFRLLKAKLEAVRTSAHGTSGSTS